jgi:hypothetical protein
MLSHAYVHEFKDNHKDNRNKVSILKVKLDELYSMYLRKIQRRGVEPEAA